MPDYKPQPQREDRSRSQRDHQRGDSGSRKSGGAGGPQQQQQQPGGQINQSPNQTGGGGGGGGRGGAGSSVKDHHRSSSGRGAPMGDRGTQQDRRRDDNRGGGGSKDPEVEIIEPTKKKFTGRCRLFIGNLPLDIKEVDLRKMFEEYGEISEFFLSQKGFGFIRLDTRAHAEACKEALDGRMLGNRSMRIRFAVHGAAVRVKELSPYVSNELLFKAFSQFGHVERAVHVVDEKGRPTGEGIVEFERKPGALEALRRAGEGVFLMASNPKPVIVEPLDPRDEDDGQPERMIPKNAQMQRELDQPPRFALPGTFEHEFGNRWKELFQIEKVRREQLEQELREGRERLEQDMDVAFQDYQAMLIREDLRRRQEELDRLEAAKRERMEIIRRRDEERASRGGFNPHGMPGFQGGYPSSFNPHHPGMGYQGHREQNQGGPPFEFELQQQQQKERFLQQQQQQQQQERRNERAPSVNSGAGAAAGEPAREQGPGDDNLVHGVQKLLQMFKGGPAPPDAQQLGQMFESAPPDLQQLQQLQQQQQMIPDLFQNSQGPQDLFQQQQQASRRMMEQDSFGQHPQKRRRF